MSEVRYIKTVCGIVIFALTLLPVQNTSDKDCKQYWVADDTADEVINNKDFYASGHENAPSVEEFYELHQKTCRNA